MKRFQIRKKELFDTDFFISFLTRLESISVFERGIQCFNFQVWVSKFGIWKCSTSKQDNLPNHFSTQWQKTKQYHVYFNHILYQISVQIYILIVWIICKTLFTFRREALLPCRQTFMPEIPFRWDRCKLEGPSRSRWTSRRCPPSGIPLAPGRTCGGWRTAAASRSWSWCTTARNC